MKINTYAYYKSLHILPSLSIEWRNVVRKGKFCALWIEFIFLFWTIEIYLWELDDETVIKEMHKHINND